MIGASSTRYPRAIAFATKVVCTLYGSSGVVPGSNSRTSSTRATRKLVVASPIRGLAVTHRPRCRPRQDGEADPELARRLLGGFGVSATVDEQDVELDPPHAQRVGGHGEIADDGRDRVVNAVRRQHDCCRSRTLQAS